MYDLILTIHTKLLCFTLRLGIKHIISNVAVFLVLESLGQKIKTASRFKITLLCRVNGKTFHDSNESEQQ